jgi:hypothetical protein
MQRFEHRLRRLGIALAATSATIGLVAVPAAARADFGPRAPATTVYVEPAPATALLLPTAPVEPSSAIHSGANNLADQALADRVATAIADDYRLDGATVTVSANAGRVSISGTAESPEQGPIAEQVARDAAGPASVSGTLSPQGG